jgi:hypothetical protein
MGLVALEPVLDPAGAGKKIVVLGARKVFEL